MVPRESHRLLQQVLRHHLPRRRTHRGPPPPPFPRLAPPPGTGSRLRRESRLGTSQLVRPPHPRQHHRSHLRQRGPRKRHLRERIPSPPCPPRRRTLPPRRLGRQTLVPRHPRRMPRHPRRRSPVRPDLLRQTGGNRPRHPPTPLRRRPRPPRRHNRLHPDAQRPRRHRSRRDRDPPHPRPLPHHHRHRLRRPRRDVATHPRPRRTGRHLRLRLLLPVGPQLPVHPQRPHRGRPHLPLHAGPGNHRRQRPRPGATSDLHRRIRLGTLLPHRIRTHPLGHPDGGRRPPRHASGRLPRSGLPPPGEGLPRLGPGHLSRDDPPRSRSLLRRLEEQELPGPARTDLPGQKPALPGPGRPHPDLPGWRARPRERPSRLPGDQRRLRSPRGPVHRLRLPPPHRERPRGDRRQRHLDARGGRRHPLYDPSHTRVRGLPGT